MRSRLGFVLLLALFVTCFTSHAEIIIVDATIAQIQTNTAYYTSDDSLYVRVTGIVTVPPGTIQTGFCNFYIQDGTGYGISLYDSDPGAASGLERGTEVQVVGHVHEYYGTTELEDFTWTGLSYDNPLPVPIEFDDMEDFNDSALPWEGSWATLKGIITADYDPQPGQTFFFELEDGSGSKARIHIYGDTNLDFSAIEAGGIITVSGVIKDGGDHVWLVPALQEDLDFIPIVDATMEEIQTNTSVYMNPDVRVRVSGIITIPAYTVHETFTDAYIQDDSGFGVNLYDPDTTAGDGFVRGRAIEIVASVQDYLGTTELVDFQPTHISDDNPLPDPMTFSNTAAFHASATYYEGTWAVLQGIITSDPNPGSWSYNFTINDGSGDATVRIWEDTNIDLSGYEIGDEIVVHGVIDQYNNVPQMMPAMGVDIELYEPEPEIIDATIAEIQQDPDAFIDPMILVRVSGVVTIPANTVHNSFADIYIQDDSGWGINIYDPDPLTVDGLLRGDEIEVVAAVLQYYDTTELIDFSWTLLSSGNPLPAPHEYLTTNGFTQNALPYEGTWSTITGTIEPGFTPTPGVSFNFTIDDGSGPATVRIWGDTGIDLTGYAEGDEIVVRGVVDSYNSVPQFMPALQEDIEDVPGGPVTLDLTVTTDTVPATGGTVVYNAHLTSQLPGSYPVQYMSTVELPNGNTVAVDNIPFTLQPFMNASFNNLSVTVPPYAPAGTYVFTGEVGAGPYWFGDSFNFYKTGAVDGILNPEDFVGIDALIASDSETVIELPTVYSVETAYPNPFNPTTTLAVNLPETAELTVTVYNITGQQVATLVNGQVNAGSHNYVFNAEHLSSGLYFIQAQVPGQLNEIQKVTLMK